MSNIVKEEFKKSRDNIEKEHLICCLDIMIGLKSKQKQRLKQSSIEEVKHYYKMKYLEHNDDMLVK